MKKVKKNAHLWERHPEDYYIEPPWCSARLHSALNLKGLILDPAAGSGNIIKTGRGLYGDNIVGTDLVKRADGITGGIDFLLHHDKMRTANIVSNPPFKHCNADAKFKFIKACLECASGTIALLLPTTWANSRDAAIFLKQTPLKHEFRISPRPSMPPGPVIEAGEKPGGGSIDFSWFVWEHGFESDVTLKWIIK